MRSLTGRVTLTNTDGTEKILAGVRMVSRERAMDHQDSILTFAAASRRQAIVVQILTTLVVIGGCGVVLGGGLAFGGNPVGGTILLSAVPLMLFKP